jgi:hypothetical protein
MRVLGFADPLDAGSRGHARAGGEPFSLPARICEASSKGSDCDEE